MHLIIKSYLKSYFKNFIEAFGLIIFMIIIMAAISGILSGVTQYITNFSAIKNSSYQWGASFQLTYNNSENIGDLIQDDQNNLRSGFINYFFTKNPNPDKSFYKPYTPPPGFKTQYNIIDLNSTVYNSWKTNFTNWLARTGNTDLDKIKEGNFLNNKILTAIGRFEHYGALEINNYVNATTASEKETTWTAVTKKIKAFDNTFAGVTNPTLFSAADNYKDLKLLTLEHFSAANFIVKNLFTNIKTDWKYTYFHNVFLDSKKTDPNEKRGFLFEQAQPANTVNGLKVYNTERVNNAVINTGTPAFVNTNAVQTKKFKNETTFSIPSAQAGGTDFKFNVEGNAITLDTVIKKINSTLFAGVTGSARPTPIANYEVVYTNKRIINALAASYFANASDNWTIADASEIYFTSPNNNDFTNLEKVLTPGFSSGDGYNTYKSSPIASATNNLRTSLYINLALSSILLLLGFVFINFTMKKEINKTRSQLGIFKAFGYYNRQLSWIFSLKFFVTAFLGAVVGFAIGIPFQVLSATSFTNSLILPFETVYVAPLFLVAFFLFIPLIFTAISYSLNFYYLRQPILDLIRGNSKARIPILARFFGLIFAKTAFTIRVQVAFTFKAFSKYVIVMLVFFISATLFIFSYTAIDQVQSLTKNLFIQYQSDVDHSSPAAPRLTSGDLESQGSDKVPYFKFLFDNGGTRYIPDNATGALNKATIISAFHKNIGQYSTKFALSLVNPKSSPWPNESFTYKDNSYSNVKDLYTAVKADHASLPTLSEKQQNIWSFMLMAAFKNNTQTAGNPEPFGIVPTPTTDYYQEARTVANAFYEFMGQKPATILNTFDPKSKGTQPFAGSLSDFVSVLLGLNIFSPITAKSAQAPLPAGWYDNQKSSILPGITPISGPNHYILTSEPNFLQQFLPALSLINNPTATSFTFNSLFYNPKEAFPLFETNFFPDNKNIVQTKAFGISQIDGENQWKKFFNFSSVPDANKIFDDSWKWEGPEKSQPVNAIISYRLSRILGLSTGSVYHMRITKNNNKITIPLQVVGILNKDTLSTNIYMSATNLKKIYRNSDGNPLSDTFFNNVVSKQQLITQHISINDFLNGKVVPHFNISNLGISLLNAGSIPKGQTSWTPFTWAQVLQADTYTSPTDKVSPPVYNPNFSQAILTNPQQTLPIGLFRQIIKQALGKIEQIITITQALTATTIALILLIVVVAIIDESTNVILTMKALGYRNRQINYIVIGNYLIGVIIVFFGAVAANLGLWALISNILQSAASITLGIPLGLSYIFICLGIILGILFISWLITSLIIKRKPINVITADS